MFTDFHNRGRMFPLQDKDKYFKTRGKLIDNM